MIAAPSKLEKEKDLLLRRTAVAAALVAAPLAFAAPAMAQPTTDINCAPCAPGSDTPIWDETFANGPWEPFFEGTDGDPDNEAGAWETGVAAVTGGAWEKAFPAE
jgi:hypothetical protein